MAGRYWNPIKKPWNRSSFIEQKKELLVFVYSFLSVFYMLEEKKTKILLFFFLFSAHKYRDYFLIFCQEF